MRAHTPPPQCSRLVPVPGTCSVLLSPLLDAKTSSPSRNTLEQGLPGLLGPIPLRGATPNPQGSAPGPLSCLHLGPQSLEQDPRPRSCGARGQSFPQCPVGRHGPARPGSQGPALLPMDWPTQDSLICPLGGAASSGRFALETVPGEARPPPGLSALCLSPAESKIPLTASLERMMQAILEEVLTGQRWSQMP